MCSSRAVSALDKCFIVVLYISDLENQTLAFSGLQKGMISLPSWLYVTLIQPHIRSSQKLFKAPVEFVLSSSLMSLPQEHIPTGS